MRLKAKNVFSLARRDFKIARSYRAMFVLDTLFGLLNLVTFYFIARIFESTEPVGLGAAPDYFAFAAVGLAIGLVIQAASVSLAHRIREEQLVGTLEMLAVQPLSTGELALGSASFHFAFAIVRSAVYLAIAGLLLELKVSDASWLGLTLMFGVIGAAFLPIGIALAALVVIFKRGEVLASLVTFGLTLVSGGLFPIAELPGWLRWIGRAMPTRFAFDGFRKALFSGHGYLLDAAALGLFAIAGVPLSIFLFSKSLDWAIRRGTISQY